MSHDPMRWFLLVVIGGIVLTQLWARVGRPASSPTVPAPMPRWTGIDTLMAVAFLAVGVTGFLLEYVYRFSDRSPQRWLAGCAAAYLAAAMCWAAAVAPERSRILFEQRQGAARNAVVMFSVGTVSLLVAVFGGP